MSDYTPPTLVIPTPGGNPGDGQMEGTLGVDTGNEYLGSYVAATSHTVVTIGSNKKSLIGANPSDIGPEFEGNLRVVGELVLDDNISAEVPGAKFTVYNGISVKGLGVPPIVGYDARTGLTAADASATTLYTTTAAGQLYR